MNHHPRINAFSIFPPGTPFRIDWFGNVAYSLDINHSQPFIAVALSEIPELSRDFWKYPTSFDARLHQRHVFVPVGFLPYLRIGDIWTRDGFVCSPDYVQESFCININRESAKLLKAGDGEGDHCGFFLPFEAHPYHSEHTHSYCVKVALGSDAHLVIPSMELIRFYFGSSSKLVSTLFSVPFQEEKLWVDAKKDEHGTAHIGLASGISGYSATDVARIAFNVVALRAAKLIGHSCVIASAAKERAYPKMFFPFVGETALNVAGVWLKTEENGMKVFLAFRLLSCSHPFPFSSLRYTMERAPIKIEATATSGKPSGTVAQPAHGSRKESRKPLDERAPSQGLAHKEIHLWNNPRFPDLTPKPVSRVDPESPGTVLSFGKHAKVESWSVGESISEKGRRPVDLIDVHGKGCPMPALTGHANTWRRRASPVSDVSYSTISLLPIPPGPKRCWFTSSTASSIAVRAPVRRCPPRPLTNAVCRRALLDARPRSGAGGARSYTRRPCGREACRAGLGWIAHE